MSKTEEQLKVIEQVNPCTYCGPLVTIGLTSGIFYTMSPDGQKNNYSEKYPDNQLKYLQNRFNICMSIIKKRLYIHGYSIHYEFNKNGNLHAHGFIIINDYEQCDANRYYIQKVFHREIGRQYLNSNIAFRTDWLIDTDYYTRYVNKENAYKADHYTTADREKIMTNFLEKSTY